jgi:glycosyltransferase involved in cell wall biosynthesis
MASVRTETSHRPITFVERRRVWRQQNGDPLRSIDPSVTLIIPVLDEADGVREIFPRIPPMVRQLIVVDGGSRDDTVKVVRRLRPNAEVVRQRGRGKGAALKTGLALAESELIVTMDGDGSMRPEDIPAFVAKLVEGHDFVKGSRALPGAGSDDFTRLRQWGNTGLTRIANVIFGSSYTDLTFGYDAYWRSTIEHLGELADGFEFEIQAAIRAATVGMRIAEVPAHEPARVGGASKLNPISDGWAILRIILAETSPRRATRLGPALEARSTAVSGV